MWDCQYFHKMFMYVLQKFLKVNHTFKHIHLIMENTILSNIFCSKHSIICRLSFPSNTRSCRSWLKYNYKEKGHMPRFLLKTNTWQKKEEMNVESWGDNKCKRWVWWGKPKGCGEHGARATTMSRAIGQLRIISLKRKGKSCFSWSDVHRHVASHGGLCTWAYMHVADMHRHGHIVAWVYMIEFIRDI